MTITVAEPAAWALIVLLWVYVAAQVAVGLVDARLRYWRWRVERERRDS